AKKRHMNKSIIFSPDLLCHVAIHFKRYGLSCVDRDQTGSRLEKSVVKLHYVRGASVIAVELAYRNPLLTDMLDHFLLQQVKIATTPAIDSLFDIAHDEVVVSLADAVGDQRKKIFPLETGSVLEFIDEIVAIKRSHLFIDERRIRFAQHPVEKLRGVVQEHHIVLVLVLPWLPRYVGNEPKRVEVRQHHLRRKRSGIILAPEFEDLVEYRDEFRLGELTQQCGMSCGLRRPVRAVLVRILRHGALLLIGKIPDR